MPGSFFGIGLASRALRHFQTALDVTGHNISNVNTPGYSRQVVDFATDDSAMVFGMGRMSMGNGVTIQSINRVRDLFLEARMQSGQGEMGRFETLTAQLKQLESAYQEPGTSGISAALNKFFDSWSGLSSNPSDPAARLAVRQAGQTLTDRIRGAFAQMSAQDGQVRTEISGTINDINTLGTRIADLNGQIRSQLAMGGMPNDLMDQRDQAIQDLSKLANVTTSQASDGTMNVYISNFALVNQAGAITYPSTYDVNTMTVSDGANTFQVRSGKLAGLMQSAAEINNQISKLDNLANTLRTEINNLHKTGKNAQGNTGIAFFNESTPPALPTGAIDFNLSTDVKTSADAIASSVSGNPGDGSLALALGNVRSQTIAALGNKSFSGYYNQTIGDLGQQISGFDSALTTQTSIVEQVENQRQSVSGVSIDDEMANMLRYQRSYQAAARVLSVFDQVTQDLLGIIR